MHCETCSRCQAHSRFIITGLHANLSQFLSQHCYHINFHLAIISVLTPLSYLSLPRYHICPYICAYTRLSINLILHQISCQPTVYADTLYRSKLTQALLRANGTMTSATGLIIKLLTIRRFDQPASRNLNGDNYHCHCLLQHHRVITEYVPHFTNCVTSKSSY